jgi:hypothetical protein
MSAPDPTSVVVERTASVVDDMLTVTRELRCVETSGDFIRVGPAGTATATIRSGVRIEVDYLQPDRLVAIEVDGPQTHVDDVDPDDLPLQPLTAEGRAVLVALVGDAAAAAVEAAQDSSFRIPVVGGARLEAAGRFALLTEMHKRMRRSIHGPWAAEAAMLLSRIDASLVAEARMFAEVAARQFTALPPNALDDSRDALQPLSGVLRTVMLLVDGHKLGSLVQQLQPRINGELGDAPDVLPIVVGSSPADVAALRGFAYRGTAEAERHDQLALAVFMDIADDLPGVFRGPATAEAEAQRVTVKAGVTALGAALPPSFLSRLRVAVHDARTGAVLDRVGFAIAGRQAVAKLEVPDVYFENADDLVVRISSEPRRVRRSGRMLELDAAVQAGQTAADAARRASVAPDQQHAREQAARWWRIAGDRWEDAGIRAQRDIARQREQHWSARSPEPNSWTFETERVIPALSYALAGDAIPVDGEPKVLLELARLARSVYAYSAAVEFGVAAIDGLTGMEAGAPDLTTDDLVGLIWSACASGDREQFGRAALSWSTAIGD